MEGLVLNRLPYGQSEVLLELANDRALDPDCRESNAGSTRVSPSYEPSASRRLTVTRRNRARDDSSLAEAIDLPRDARRGLRRWLTNSCLAPRDLVRLSSNGESLREKVFSDDDRCDHRFGGVQYP